MSALVLSSMLDEETLVGFVQEILQGTLWDESVAVLVQDDPFAGVEDVLTGAVWLSGGFNGAVRLRTTRQTALNCTVAATKLPADILEDEHIRDAFGEITNILGGNIKALLPGPSQLTVPEVTDAAISIEGVLGARLALHTSQGLIEFTLWGS